MEGRSRCPKCKKQIRALDNIPLFSYLLLHGRCRYCKKTISKSYPVVEFLTGILFVWWYLGGTLFFRLAQSPFDLIQPTFWLVVGLLLLAIFFADLTYGLIPDILVFILVGMSFLYRLILTTNGLMQPQDFWLSVISGFGASLFFLLLIFITRGKGMGMGDAKLSFALGLVLGWPRIFIGLFTSFISGAIIASILVLFGKRKFGQTVPFGPFLVLGTIVALAWGEKLWVQYLQLLF